MKTHPPLYNALMAISFVLLAFSCGKKTVNTGPTVLEADVTLSSQAEVNAFWENGYIFIGRQTIHIEGTGISDLSSLSTIDFIKGILYVKCGNALTSLSGLENITSVEYLYIENNGGLTNFCSLQSLLSGSGLQGYDVNNNVYNPTKQDIIDGNCAQPEKT